MTLDRRGKVNTQTKLLAAAAASCSLVLAMTVPAHAEEAPNELMEALAEVSESSEGTPADVLGGVADVDTTAVGESAIDERVGATMVSIPTDPRDDLALTLDHVGIDISVGLPFAEQASAARVERDGIVSYDNRNGSTTVPVVKDDGSVQITTVIESALAPTRYEYTIALPDGGYLEQLDQGMIIIRDETGGFQGGVLPPWAKDARGDDVATHFEIDGGLLTQVVEHDATTAYPVVADPLVGGGLLAGYWKNRPGGYAYKTGSQWSTHLSPWGAAVYSQGIVGIEIIKNEGWTEWRNFPTTPVNATIEQQYKCHAQFGYAVWLGGTWWDFETARGANHNWLSGSLQHKCNWT